MCIALIMQLPQKGVAKTADEFIKCDNGKVSILSIGQTFKLCINKDCQRIENELERVHFLLPISPLNAESKIEVISDIGNISKICSPLEFCESAKTLLSKALMGNPHCWPIGAIVSITVIIQLLISTSLLIIWMVKQYRNRKNSTKHLQLKVKDKEINNDEIKKEEGTFSLSTFKTVSLAPTATLLIIITTLIDMAGGCQQGYMRQTIDMICDNKEQCRMEYRREMLFNNLNKELCIQIKHDNKTIGGIRIKKGVTTMKCMKQTLFYTRDTETKTFSKLRCPQMGSCDLSKKTCERMRADQEIEELNEAHDFPGYSSCERTCGGALMSCLCFLPMKACNFYKVAHIPIAKDAYHIFKCSQWKMSVSVWIEETILSKSTTKLKWLEPHKKYQLENANITIISIQQPHHRLMDTRFAQNEEETLVIPENFEFPVICRDKEQVLTRFKQCKNNHWCNCNAQNSPISCQCPLFKLDSLKNSSGYRIPISTETMDFLSTKNSVSAKSNLNEMVILWESRKLLHSSQCIINQQCTVKIDKLVGCYSCEVGSRLNITCTSELPLTTVIMCSEQSFPVECNKKEKVNTVRLEYDSSEIRDTCTVKCGTEKKTFEIQGELLFHAEAVIKTAITNNIIEHEFSALDWFYSTKLPDLKPLIKILSKHWKIAIGVSIALGVTTAATYFLGPVAIIYIIKGISFAIKILIKVTSTIATTTVVGVWHGIKRCRNVKKN